MELVILGNGFDINFNMKTKYSDFKKYLDEKCFFENYHFEVFFPYFDNIHIINEDEDIIDFEYPLITIYGSSIPFKSYNWGELEKLISNPSYLNIKGFYGICKVKWIDYDCIIEEFNNMLTELKLHLKNWIKSMGYKKTNYKFKDNLLFLSFNYTKTLEQSFNVSSDRICYIHNNCEDHKIIFGCMKEEIDFFYDLLLYKDKIDKNIKRCLYKYVKDTKRIIDKKLVKYLDDVVIDKVYVLGHSLADVDKNYFKYINEKYPLAKWYISYYINGNESKEEVIYKTTQKVLDMGIKNFELFLGIDKFCKTKLFQK